jgi:hypothetical protein
MVPHSLLWHYLWIAPHLLQIPLAILIFRRKLHQDFPWFLTYTIYQVVANALLFGLNHAPQVSGWWYHVATGADTFFSIVLRFAVIAEIFRFVLCPYEALQRVSSLMANSTLVALLAGASIVAVYGPKPGYTTRLIALSVSMDRAASLVQLGLLLFLFVFSYYFRISWRSFVFGIASGLALYLAVQLAVSALAAHTYIAAANTIDTGAYHCSVLIWLGYLLLPHRSPVRVKSLPNHQLESWNLELERLLQR